VNNVQQGGRHAPSGPTSLDPLMNDPSGLLPASPGPALGRRGASR